MRKHILPIRATHRLLLIFAATILAPGLVLGFFGVRALTQERRLGDQQIRERLNGVAESTGRGVELKFREWQQRVDELARPGPENPTLWPVRLRDVVESGDAVVLTGERPQVHALPAGRLLYELAPITEESHQPPPLLLQAESLELREKQYDRAIAIYRQLLANKASKSAERAGILHRLARSLKKAGQIDEAARTFRLLENEPSTRIGSLPSDLIASFEILPLEQDPDRSRDALRLYRRLVEGKWRLEKSSYAFYSEKVRDWIPRTAETIELTRQEERKLALSSAAEHFAEEPRTLLLDEGLPVLAFWRTEPFAAILLAEPFFRTHVLPAAGSTDFQFSLHSPDGHALVGNSSVQHEPVATYTLQNAVLPLRLTVWPKDPAALYATVKHQQNLYLGMLAIVVALLGFGGYLTVHTLKTELAVAQMKSDFVSTVSHEFRSPLAGINQLGEMLRDGRVQDQGRRQEYYEMIVTETQRLRRLVENILDFARMEDGRKQYHFEPIEPAVWLREVADDFQAQVAAAGFAIEASIPEELPAIVADRETLTTAMHNLLDNAVKYSRDSHTVRLEANANGDGLAISVCDRGVGIRDEDRARIFERFYRGGGDIAKQVKGVGLGLNLVQHIVAAHGGSIDFESKEGEGSTFTIHLKTARRES